ncbi:MAG: hypothetical protein AAF202_09030 [Pseudomonadota bacterium]
MGRLFRFLKFSFMIGGGIAALMMFNSADTPFDLKHWTGSGLDNDLVLEETFEELRGEDTNAAQKALTQAYLEKSKRDRAKKAIVRYRDVDYVFINDKYYPYNPKNVYMVNGVKTYYEPGGHDEQRELRAKSRIKMLESKHKVSNAKLVDNAEELLDNPLKGYSPQGIRKMQETLKQIKQQAESRNKFMESL